MLLRLAWDLGILGYPFYFIFLLKVYDVKPVCVAHAESESECTLISDHKNTKSITAYVFTLE